IEHELGITIEYRNKSNLLHISYGYITRVKGEIGKPSYEQGEIDDGYESVWVPLEESIELIEKHRTSEQYKSKFIIERELIFLKEALSILQNKQ
ncbi:MAG: ADP-ribose pyrophosphatase, partial [Candidatus Pacebacteria bacterium]|nr:ADP-ribose pyrophosphatase [Candidatus Paceibacterota bacterium]